MGWHTQQSGKQPKRNTASDVWVFVYGSHLCRGKLLSTVGGVLLDDQVATAKRFEVVFNKKSTNWNFAANLVAAPRKKCYGVICRMTPGQFDKLRDSEAGYVSTCVPVEATSGEKIVARTFVAKPERTVNPGRPKKEYVDFIWLGGLERGIPRRYLKGLLRKAGQPT